MRRKVAGWKPPGERLRRPLDESVGLIQLTAETPEDEALLLRFFNLAKAHLGLVPLLEHVVDLFEDPEPTTLISAAELDELLAGDRPIECGTFRMSQDEIARTARVAWTKRWVCEGCGTVADKPCSPCACPAWEGV